jgi:hypothetical protein
MPGSDQRQKRLAEALRQNLKKRKAQMRGRHADEAIEPQRDRLIPAGPPPERDGKDA